MRSSLLLPVVVALLAGALVSLAGCDANRGVPAASSGSPGRPVIAMMPKLMNIDYFDACKRGAEKAAKEIGVDLVYDGPTEATAEGQNQFLETWIRKKVSEGLSSLIWLFSPRWRTELAGPLPQPPSWSEFVMTVASGFTA